MARKPMMVGNWKMNLTLDQAAGLAADIRTRVAALDRVERILCPAFTALAAVRDALAGSTVGVGAQNMHTDASGAYTGEIGSQMLQGLVTHVILGHSERRTHCHETDADINRKVHAALQAGLIPIVCVGENEVQRQAGETAAVITQQVTAALADVSGGAAPRLVIAYEPVWAIGTGLAADPDLANTVCGDVIRILMADLYDGTVAEQVRILYGGSTNPANIESFMAKADIDGALIGGAALSSDSYGTMVSLTARQIAA